MKFKWRWQEEASEADIIQKEVCSTRLQANCSIIWKSQSWWFEDQKDQKDGLEQQEKES